jgi:uncharacterized protein (TIGR03435 family)
MLKSMLRDRFGLKARFITKQMPTIVLAFNSPSARRMLHPATEKVDCQPFLLDLRSPLEGPLDSKGHPLCVGSYFSMTRRTHYFRSVPVDNLAHFLEGRLDRPVEIASPTEGLFDFDLHDQPGVPDIVPPSKRQALVPAYLAALEEQLGARAELRTITVRVLAIESATKPRTGT